MFGLLMMMFGIAIAMGAKELFQKCEGSEKAVESAKGKTVEFFDRLFK